MLDNDISLVVNGVVNSIDFNTYNYRKSSDIDFSQLDLSKVPSADFSDLNLIVEEINSCLDNFNSALEKSRISIEKKEQGKNHIQEIKYEIERYNNPVSVGDMECNRYDSAKEIVQWLSRFLSFTPSSIKNTAKGLYDKCNHVLKKIEWKESDRRFIIKRISEEILDNSEKYRIESYKKQIEEAGSLSFADLEKRDSDYLSASIGFLSNKFGSGVSDFVRGIIHSTRENSIRNYLKDDGTTLIALGWTFSKYVEGIVNCAKYLHVKEFAFYGSSTEALPCLNVLSKLGISFTIEEVNYKDPWESTKRPVALVTL